MRIVLEPGATVRGRVTDSGGAPVAATRVTIAGRTEERFARTDSDGRYAIRGVSPGEYGLTACEDWGSGRRANRSIVVRPDHGEMEQDIALEDR